MSARYIRYMRLIIALLFPAMALGQAPKDFLEQRYPLLDSIAGVYTTKSDIYVLNDYTYKITETDWIRGERDIQHVLFIRDDQVIPLLTNVLTEIDETEDGFYNLLSNLFTELQTIGLTVATAEGFFVGLGRGVVLEDELRAHASEEYRLWIDVTVAWDETVGGEYPYADVSAETRVLAGCEQLLTKFPDSEYKPPVTEMLQSVVETLADIHRVLLADYEFYVYSGVGIEEWPFMTETESAALFVATHPNSHFAPLLGAILANPSELDFEAQTIYYVVTDWLPNHKAARHRAWQYLSSGRDIAHILDVQRTDGSVMYAVGYRFFSSQEYAKEVQELLAETLIESELVTLTNLHEWASPLKEMP